MIGYDDPWIAPCGKAFGDLLAYYGHTTYCCDCSQIRWREFDTAPPPEENDADDRGICYEDD